MADDSPWARRDEQARPDHRHPAGRRHPHGHRSTEWQYFFYLSNKVLLSKGISVKCITTLLCSSQTLVMDVTRDEDDSATDRVHDRPA